MLKFLVLLFISGNCIGQIEEVRRITEQLCSPEFHGRGYVEKGDSLASSFLAEEFSKINVKPFGNSYFQNFNLDVNTFPGRMSVSQNGRAFIPGKDYSIDPSSRGQKVQLTPVEIPRNKVLDIDFIKKMIEIAALPDESTNAILFDFTTLSKDTITKVRGLTHEIAEYVPVIEIVNEKFTWSVGRSQRYWTFLQIQDSVYDRNSPIDVDIEAEMIKNYSSRNVLAYIPSKKKCAKTMVYTAHYDHLGRMGSETYFPGANDNASGTAMLFTMANYFKKNPSNYNVLFIAFAGEEAGLIGSKYFVENSPIKLKKIEFLVNLDIMGSGEDGITVVNATLFEKEFELLETINSEMNLLKEVKKRGPAANSDHYWFTQKGVPAFFIYTRGPNKHYHDVFDAYEALSFKEYEDITTLLVEFVNRK